MRKYNAHIGEDYGVSESTCYRNCVWVEKTLLKNKKFRIPGKKELKKGDNEIEIILIDVSETAIERPKKRKQEDEK